MRALIWFKNDLRTADNPALHEASKKANRGVVAAYVVCPEQWRQHDTAAVKVDFILRNLQELSDALAKRNIALKIIETPTFQNVPHELRHIAEDFKCDTLFFNREYEVNERRRDAEVTKTFENAGCKVHAFTDQCIFEPGKLLTGQGRYYTIYTPFKRAWYKAYEEDLSRSEPLGLPKKQPEMLGRPDEVPDSVEGFDPERARPDLWVAGEKAARSRLNEFIRSRIETYVARRDFPAVNGTSVLSPYLANGVISLRQCVYAALGANEGRLETGSKSIVHWISELIWREFYKHILVGYPRVCMHRAFRPETERLGWKENDDHFQAWCEGRTGYPVVDAAMRQLRQTGWMHNRLRMIVAMFFSKNLFLDWRKGERFFMQHLVDGDLAANNGGWQWSASTGTDAAPYFRIFNPYSQSRKFDPDGTFIRRFVPELAGVEGPEIHDPSSMSGLLQNKLDYPDPIVDHAESRHHALAAFRALKA
ncbi:MAG: deoxyribodipyrimidine photo-lyase [Phycisphaerales bacterium]|nr:deoxyribodipyrimidine photo-lyase [Phycisphaerales bacterium]